MAHQRNHILPKLILTFFLGVTSLAHADLKSDMARLETIQLLLEKDNQAALLQLKEFYSQLNAQTDYQVRIDTLRELSYAYYDAGDIPASEQSRAEILRLAKLQNDKETVALMQIDEVFKLRDTGQFDAAIAKLDDVAAAKFKK